MDKEQLEYHAYILKETRLKRDKLLSLLNNIDDKINTLTTILQMNCPHENKTREYDECDQRNYYHCALCGLL